MAIGIISAMEEEVSSLLSYIENAEITTIGKREYIKGKLFQNEIVLVFSRWGKVASSSTVTTLIDKFNVEEVIFTGVAGSINNNIKIGDIVIGDKLYQHDMNGSPLFEKYEIPLLNKSYFQTDESIKNNLYKATILFINENDLPKIPKNRIGNIGTGDKFINEKQDAIKIARIDDIICVEMEGAAVAQVCYEHDIPFGIVRIISDESDSDAHIDFQEFIKSTATVYSLGIIKNYLTNRLIK